MEQWKIPALIISLGLNVVLSTALVNTENQRNALITNVCDDPNFKGVDKACLKYVESRPHWWQHWTYAVTHILGYESDVRVR